MVKCLAQGTCLMTGIGIHTLLLTLSERHKLFKLFAVTLFAVEEPKASFTLQFNGHPTQTAVIAKRLQRVMENRLKGSDLIGPVDVTIISMKESVSLISE